MSKPTTEPKCVWCGKTLAEHMDKELPGARAKVPCLMTKAGFVPQAKTITEYKKRIFPKNLELDPTQPPMRGWQCPRCFKILSPFIRECSCT